MDELHISTRDEYGRHLVSMLAAIDKSAREAARPYVDALVRLRANDPPPPFFLTKEQSEELAAYLPRIY